MCVYVGIFVYLTDLQNGVVEIPLADSADL